MTPAATLSVRDIMVGETVAVGPDAPILAAIRRMNGHRIGAVLVAVGTTLHGIFTERDLLRLAAEAAPGWRQLPVGDWMTSDPFAVSPDAGWEDAVALMERLHVRHLPVVDDGKLVGIVSSRQLIARRTDHLNRLVEERTRELQQLTADLLERERQTQYQLRIAGRLLGRALLPKGPPAGDDLAWAIHYTPLGALGGDYYDFVVPDERYVGVLMADASGHSVAAAMVAVMARIAFAEVVRETVRPGEVLRGMNERLVGLTEERFVTAFFGLLDRRTREFVCANAGHPHPLRHDAAAGQCHPFGPRGLMLGVIAEADYPEETVTLGRGDRVCFYTDGVVEAMNATGETYGGGRLQALLTAHAAEPAADILRGIESDLNWFRGDQGHGDDVTLLVAEVR
jgi:sigma-B regulation protein RsbU (phosphoserine phosphatase)